MNIAALADRVIAQTGVLAVIRCGYVDGEPVLSFVCPDGTSTDKEAAVSSIVSAWPAEQARLDAAQSVEDWFRGQLAAGYQTTHGWRLGMEPNDVTLLTGHFVLAKEASTLGLPVPPLVDATGVPRHLSMQQLTEVMLGYGSHRAALSEEYAARMAAISATTA